MIGPALGAIQRAMRGVAMNYTPTTSSTNSNIKDRARAYISRMPAAIAGNGGHTATYNVAVVLIKGFALDEGSALDLLAAWNECHCEPKWSERDLRYKLRSAARSSRAFGYLLEDGPLLPSQSHNHTHTQDANSEFWKARQRTAWPKVSPLTSADIQAISILRNIPMAAVDLSAKAGFLGAGIVDGHRTFIIAESRFAQARRFDGKPFLRTDGSTIKSKNLCGSEGAFIGQRWLGKANPILLVEGAIALLEAAAAILLADRTDWTCLAATSAASRFTRDPALLARLAGRRIRIIPDADDAGLDAAGSWLAALEDVGATVDALSLPSPYKDLGELIANTENAPNALTPHLSELFTF